jgi:uncharacterized membrane protein
MARARGDGGLSVPLTAAALLVAVVGLSLTARMGEILVDHARARTAADAAALAGAIEGRDAASDAAVRNGAQLTAFTTDGATATATVSVGQTEATATATRLPPSSP